MYDKPGSVNALGDHFINRRGILHLRRLFLRPTTCLHRGWGVRRRSLMLLARSLSLGASYSDSPISSTRTIEQILGHHSSRRAGTVTLQVAFPRKVDHNGAS